MKSITPALATHLAGDTTTLARLWKLKRKATVEVSPVKAYSSGPLFSPQPSGQNDTTADEWEFNSNQWRTTGDATTSNHLLGYLYADTFGFNIPVTATISGIAVQVAYISQSTTGAYIANVSLFNGSSAVGTAKLPDLGFTPSYQVMNLGGQTDTWGYTLTPAVVNSSTFGFGLKVYVNNIRCFLQSFGMTVYYTLPATGGGSAYTVSMAANLIVHTNFTGNQEADTSADSQSGAGQIAIDSSNALYVYSPYGGGLALQGQVRKFDTTTGALIGTLATGVNVPNNSRTSGGGYILHDPAASADWFLISGGEVWGQTMAAVHTVSGTATNTIAPCYNGLSAGGNSGGMDVDNAGNVWVFSNDNGGTYAGIPRLIKISISGSTLSQISTTALNVSPWNFTTANGVKFDPGTGNLILFGQTTSGNQVYRVDQSTTAYTILASSTVPFGVPDNMGADGTFISGPNITKYRCSDFASLLSTTASAYGDTAPVNALWYDWVHNFVYLYSSFWNTVEVCDLSSPGIDAALSDPSQSNPAAVSAGNQFLSPDCSILVTQASGSNSFLDVWGTLEDTAAFNAGPYVVMGFTDHDQDITYDDGSGDGPITYIAHTGSTFTAIDSKPDMSVDNLDIDSFLESDAITQRDLRGGLYDGAECTVMLVNWADLTQGHMNLRFGVLGNVKIVNQQFTVEVRGLGYTLGITTGSYYGPLCRAELFSDPNNMPGVKWYCNLNAALYQQNNTVGTAPSLLTLTPGSTLNAVSTVGAGGPAPAGYFNYGLLTFTSGVLQNQKYEIESWDGTTLTLFFEMAQLPSSGDSFIIEPGCDKLITTCISKFNNAINFRGEPWIPGLDALLDIKVF